MSSQSLENAKLKNASAKDANDSGSVLEPLAVVQGEPYRELPKDLYIPPDALEVVLDAFEGPLDLLLYLIRRQNLNILDIPVALITKQYMDYIAMLDALRFELAAEYLVMAAMLAEIKSRLLLPRISEVADEEDDPRAELVRRLQEYERYKSVAEAIDELPRLQRDIHTVQPEPPNTAKQAVALPDISLQEMLLALRDVLNRAELFQQHRIERETLTVRARMTHLLGKLSDQQFVEFSSLFDVTEGRAGVVVTFLAILELVRESLVDIVQNAPCEALFVKQAGVLVAAANDEAPGDEQE